jgi:hypothetical protein
MSRMAMLRSMKRRETGYASRPGQQRAETEKKYL